MQKEFKFPVPEGFAAPEDSKAGEPFEVMATVVMGEDGMLSLNAIDGAPLAAESAETSEDSEAEGPEMEIEAPAGGGFLMAIEDGVAKKGQKA